MDSLWRSSPHEILTAWQNGEITFRLCMRMIGADDVMELLAAARSSGVEIRGLGERDRALLDRAARMLGNRIDTVGFWRRADERARERMDERAARADVKAALEVLDLVPDVPPAAGDELHDGDPPGSGPKSA